MSQRTETNNNRKTKKSRQCTHVRVVTARVQAAHEVASNAAEAVDRDAELHRGVCAAAVGGAERACGGDGASGRQHCYGVVGVGMRRGKGEGRGERGGNECSPCVVCVVIYLSTHNEGQG